MAVFNVRSGDVTVRIEHHLNVPFNEAKQYRIGRGGRCVDIIYDPIMPTELILEGVSYYEDCLSNKEIMKRGVDTVSMTKIALLFAIDHLKNNYGIDILHISISDNSTIQCFGQTVLLCAFDFLLYGYTWYERRFGAVPTSGNHEQILTQYRNLLNTPLEFAILAQILDNQESIQLAEHVYTPNNTWSQQCLIFNKQYNCDFVLRIMNKIFEKLGINVGNLQRYPFIIPKLSFDSWRTDYVLNVTAINGGRHKPKKSRHNRLKNRYGIGKMVLTLEDGLF